MNAENDRMTFGVVAVLDALGFKGIWGRHQPQQILDNLGIIRTRMDASLKIVRRITQEKMPENFNLKFNHEVLFFSDSVILAVWFAPDRIPALAWVEEIESVTRLLALVYCCGLVSSFVGQSLLVNPAINYQGCVSEGRFATGKDVIIGPAIDEAAENHQRADGAFVWLAPGAASSWKAATSSDESQRGPVLKGLQKGFATAFRPIVLDYPIPMKGLGQLTAPAINPFACLDVHDRQNARTNALASFNSTALDVCMKKENTQRFHSAAIQHSGAS